MTPVSVGDVIQLDPSHCRWGPLLCIVDEVKSWGVCCHWLQTTTEGMPLGVVSYRAEYGTFHRIGRAEWVPA